MRKAIRIMLGMPLIMILSAVQVIMTVFSMIGAAVTTVIAILMYLTLGMVLLFQLQPFREVVLMSIAATGILLSPMLVMGGSTLAAGLKQIIILWME